MNVVKSGIWTVIFVLDVISAVDNSQSRTASFLAIIIDGILVYVHPPLDRSSTNRALSN
jgi:hypothetical protein